MTFKTSGSVAFTIFISALAAFLVTCDRSQPAPPNETADLTNEASMPVQETPAKQALLFLEGLVGRKNYDAAIEQARLIIREFPGTPESEQAEGWVPVLQEFAKPKQQNGSREQFDTLTTDEKRLLSRLPKIGGVSKSGNEKGLLFHLNSPCVADGILFSLTQKGDERPNLGFSIALDVGRANLAGETWSISESQTVRIRADLETVLEMACRSKNVHGAKLGCSCDKCLSVKQIERIIAAKKTVVELDVTTTAMDDYGRWSSTSTSTTIVELTQKDYRAFENLIDLKKIASKAPAFWKQSLAQE